MEDNILQLVFTSVILGRMMYAISVWWGYATAADKTASLGIYPTCGMCWSIPSRWTKPAYQLVSDGDDTLFARMMANQHHVMRQLLPSTTTRNYGLHSRRHYTLNIKSETCCRSFITRLLYKDMYWLTHFCLFKLLFYFLFYFNHCISCILTTHSINKYDDDEFAQDVL